MPLKREHGVDQRDVITLDMDLDPDSSDWVALGKLLKSVSPRFLNCEIPF